MDIIVKKINEVFLKIECDNKGILREINEKYSFFIPNFNIMRKKSARLYNWDGKIRLFSLQDKKLPYGLLEDLIDYCKERKYNLILDTDIRNDYSYDFSKDLDLFIEYIKPSIPFEIRDYQLNAFKKSINRRRSICISPVGSGKSLIIYLITRFCIEVIKYKKILIIVPTVSLVEQLYDNFKEYGYTEDVHKIYSGVSKSSIEKIFISTWQSLHLLNVDYFSMFECVILDEAHSGVNSNPKESASIRNILERCINAKHRIGLTGTIRKDKGNIYSIISLLGNVYNTISINKLVDRKQLSNFKLNIIKLQYTDEEKKLISKANDYIYEMEFLENHKARNMFIANFANVLENNTLLLFKTISHGKFLFDYLTVNSNKTIYYIDGDISVEEREDIRHIMEKRNDIILVGSMGTMSTGVNIKNLHNLIFSISYKSQIKIIQSIGRSLRLNDNKNIAMIYDFVDQLGTKSYSVKQAVYRIKEIYIPNNFEYEEFNYKF